MIKYYVPGLLALITIIVPAMLIARPPIPVFKEISVYDAPYFYGYVVDPVGDDDGFGNITYPTNDVFQPGVFDLVNFSVYGDDSYIYFNITFRNLGDNPWNGPNNFSLQYIQVYVLTTDQSLPWDTYTFGLNVTIWHGWNYAVLLVPGWDTSPIPAGQLSAIYTPDGFIIATEDSGDFDVYAVGDSVIAKISRSILADTDNVDKWIYTVAVAGYDGFEIDKVRKIVSGSPTEWMFGGGDQEAIDAGVQPLVIDLLAPTPSDQYEMLRSYDAYLGKQARIGGIDLSGGFYPPGSMPRGTTITETETTTLTLTETETVTETSTLTTTETRTVTETETITSTTTTTTANLTITHTVTETETATVTKTETETRTVTATPTVTVTETSTATETETYTLITTTISYNISTTTLIITSSTEIPVNATVTTTKTVTETVNNTVTETYTTREYATTTYTSPYTTTVKEQVVETTPLYVGGALIVISLAILAFTFLRK